MVGTADTPEQRIVAAVLATGAGAMASHRSAAHLHGVPGLGPTTRHCVDVIVAGRNDGPHGGRTVNAVGPDGVVVHRPRDLLRLTPQRIDGIACTNILRTLVDLGAVASDAVCGAVGHALANDLVSLDAVATALAEHSQRGRHGVTALRVALDDWNIADKPADSVLEPAMQRVVAGYGLPPVEFHPSIGGREVDFRVLGTPIVLECDGWASHRRSRDEFQRDRAMDAEFATHGWMVIRFTYRRMTRRPADVARVIRRAIACWTDRPAPDAA